MRALTIQLVLIAVTLAIAFRVMSGTGARTQAVRRLGMLVLRWLRRVVHPLPGRVDHLGPRGRHRSRDRPDPLRPGPRLLRLRRDHLQTLPRRRDPLHQAGPPHRHRRSDPRRDGTRPAPQLTPALALQLPPLSPRPPTRRARTSFPSHDTRSTTPMSDHDAIRPIPRAAGRTPRPPTMVTTTCSSSTRRNRGRLGRKAAAGSGASAGSAGAGGGTVGAPARHAPAQAAIEPALWCSSSSRSSRSGSRS